MLWIKYKRSIIYHKFVNYWKLIFFQLKTSFLTPFLCGWCFLILYENIVKYCSSLSFLSILLTSRRYYPSQNNASRIISSAVDASIQKKIASLDSKTYGSSTIL